MDIEELYDEFGNYIGPDQSDSDSDSLQLPDAQDQAPQTEPSRLEDGGLDAESYAALTALQEESSVPPSSTAPAQSIVLAEDKQLYPTAEEVFGADAEVLVEEEDAQLLSEPLVAPVVESSSGFYESDSSVPPSKYSRSYLTSAVAPYPLLVRNVALVGHLHHGKTSIVDMLFGATHVMPWAKLDDRNFPVRYADNRRDEQQLRVSIKTTAAAFLLQTHLEKSYAVTVLDTPGHPNFLDEVYATLTIADGVVAVVDVAEGVMLGTQTVLRRAASMRLDIVLIITKIDRLCLELRLPPADAYHKIRHIIDSCNEIISPFNVPLLSPASGNVAFASPTERVCFTLTQFSRAYIRANGGENRFPLTATQLARRFWGNIYYDMTTRKFSDRSPTRQSERTFVSFILEPYYKLHTAVVSKDIEELANFLKNNDLFNDGKRGSRPNAAGTVSNKMLNADLKATLKAVNSSCFDMGSMSGFTEMIVNHIKSPTESTARVVDNLSKVDWPREDALSDMQRKWRNSMAQCDTDKEAPMAAFVAKLVPDERGSRFDCLLRVLSGRLRVGQNVCVLGQSYDEILNREDMASATVEAIHLPCARFKVEIKEAVAGQIILVRGIDQTITKSATIISSNLASNFDALALRSIQEFLLPAVVKVAVEPVKPAELPKMVSSLRKCANSYPGLVIKVEETGEHTLVGSGELYMDCVLRDLREAYDKVEVKVSDPLVPFAETVSETSALQCQAETPNGKNKIVTAAEPLEESVLNALDENKLESSDNLRVKLREYGWDALAAKSLWTFGPDPSRGPNALLNDVLIEDSRFKSDLLRDSIVQGFSWAMREGPLADEPVRGVKVRLLDTRVSEDELGRSAAQVIPTARRVVFASILTAGPRMMEPINVVEIICSPEASNVANTLVTRRRGMIVAREEIAGTPLLRITAHMPVLDSFGFEPDLRSLTMGSAFVVQMFDHWAVVPGEPLDRTIQLRPLQPARRHELGREVLLKTRRRKGLSLEVSLTKYLDDPLFAELAADNEELKQLLLLK